MRALDRAKATATRKPTYTPAAGTYRLTARDALLIRSSPEPVERLAAL